MSTEVNTIGDDKIGGYRFVRTISNGTTTTVMEVLQEASGKRFVMKQLLPSKGHDPSERRALEFEAKLGMELRHPNLIRVHEYVRDRDQPYFVMDFFPSIHMRLVVGKPDKYGLPKGRLHGIIMQSGSALSYMHEKNWVHRDVKPENIIVSKAGETRLIDYALAMRPFSGLKKLLGAKPKRQGTHSYMSPEQIRCEPPAPSADIYSFGITCYELACGRQPFRANSHNDLLAKHLREHPSPPTVHNRRITPEYSDLVMSMIRKRPADRLADMRTFLGKFSRIKIYDDDPEPMSSRF